MRCVQGNRNTGFKPRNCQSSGRVGGASGPCWGQQTAGTAAVSCSALAVGMAEWWAHSMSAWCLLTVTHRRGLKLVCQCCDPALLSSIQYIHDYFLFAQTSIKLYCILVIVRNQSLFLFYFIKLILHGFVLDNQCF